MKEKLGSGDVPAARQGGGGGGGGCCSQGTLEWGQAQESHFAALNLQGKCEASEGRGWFSLTAVYQRCPRSLQG